MKINLSPPLAIHELGQRDNQEDALFPAPADVNADSRVFILCDGMGGHAHGEVASNTVAQTMGRFLSENIKPETDLTDQLIADALKHTYEALDEKDNGEEKKMGTTLCLLTFTHSGVSAAHIGDSRIYHIRPREHRVLYQSRDHSLVYELYRAGEITKEEIATSPQKNIITRAVQPGEERRTYADIMHTTDVQPGDYFYLCSDGMLEQMDNEDLCNILSEEGSDEKKRQRLIAETTDNHDNHTAWLVRVESVTMEAGDERYANDEATTNCNALNLKPIVPPYIPLFPGKGDSDVSVVGEGQAKTAGRHAHSTPPRGIYPQPQPRSIIRGILSVLLSALLVIAIAACAWYFLGSGNPTTKVKLKEQFSDTSAPASPNSTPQRFNAPEAAEPPAPKPTPEKAAPAPEKAASKAQPDKGKEKFNEIENSAKAENKEAAAAASTAKKEEKKSDAGSHASTSETPAAKKTEKSAPPL